MPAKQRILSINSGSSSIKFAMYECGESLPRVLEGRIERIGLPDSALQVNGSSAADNFFRSAPLPNHAAAVSLLMDWLKPRCDNQGLAAIGHRIVHGGPQYCQPQRICAKMLNALHRFSPFDPEHLPAELILIEAFQQQFPEIQQVACFDTAFHQHMPQVAQLLPIPRSYAGKGVRRYGFHGLSYTYLMEELVRLGDPAATMGRVILAHLGNGASLAAVRNGSCIDTSMSFTPTSGLPMSTRSGDLDPGLVWFLAKTENMNASQFNTMVNTQCGLLGISETSSDVRDLLEIEADDFRAAEALSLFCYQVKKWIGSFAAALGGLDTLVFAGGIGENAPVIRSRICDGLEFLDLQLDHARNTANAGVISRNVGGVTVRVIPTDESQMIARSVCRVLDISVN
jgi:acetate kinase